MTSPNAASDVAVEPSNRKPEAFAPEAASAFEHVRWLSEALGPRPSCSANEQRAAAYAAGQLEQYGMAVERTPCPGSAFTYLRYALISAAAAAAALAAFAFPLRLVHLLAAACQAAAAQAMLFESDFRGNWSRRIIRDRASEYVTGRMQPAGATRQAIVLVAHLDTARTPAFNASRRGQRAYNLLFKGLLGSFCAAAVLQTALALEPGLPLTGWLAALAALQLVALILFIAAESTPFSPGAYDNASGVASVLALAAKLGQQPLAASEVWFCLTGCEETGSAGAVALFERYQQQWGDAWIINLDQLGYEALYLRTREGLLRRYNAPAACLAQASAVADSLPQLRFSMRPSQAYSDAAPAYQRRLRAFSFGSSPADNQSLTHRHRLTDTAQHLSTEAFAANLCYLWTLITRLDAQAREASHE